METVADAIAFSRDSRPGVARGVVESLQLSRWPVGAIASVVEDGAPLVEGTDYSVDYDLGRLSRLDLEGLPRRWTAAQLVVTYQAGYWLPGSTGTRPAQAQDLPADLQDAVGRMVFVRLAERKRDPLLKSEYVDGVGRREFIVPSVDGNLSPDVSDILDNYRVPVVA